MEHFVVLSNTGPCKTKNQRGGREYDDLQNWLDMTSPKKHPVYATIVDLLSSPDTGNSIFCYS